MPFLSDPPSRSKLPWALPSRGSEGVSHLQVRIHPERGLDAQKDRCSLDLVPFEVFPCKLAGMLPHQLLSWASSLKHPDISLPKMKHILPFL
jgi:hypothetical protein